MIMLVDAIRQVDESRRNLKRKEEASVTTFPPPGPNPVPPPAATTGFAAWFVSPLFGPLRFSREGFFLVWRDLP